MNTTPFIITIICSVMASSGFWAFVMRQCDGNKATKEMLVGLGHDRIIYLGLKYIERGYITMDEYENINKYLYLPYEKLGGNGSAERIMDQVKTLEVRK